MASILIVTCGDSDLQVAVPGEDGPCLVRMGPDTQRAIHERLLSGELRYQIRPDAAGLPRLGNARLWERDGRLLVGDGPDNAAAHTPADGLLSLVPVKLAGIERIFQHTSKIAAPDTIVVFNTRRTRRTDEPIAAGRILATWLAELFGLPLADRTDQFERGSVCALDYVDDAVPADGKRGRPVNPAAVQRIDDVLSCVRPEVVSSVIFSLSGGIPAYRDQIRACAHFRFETARFFDCVRADDPENGLVTSHAPTLLPSDSFHARREVRRLIRKGDFHGASVLAGQFSKQPDEKKWAVTIRRAFRFLDGQLQNNKTVPGLADEVINERPPRCLLAAFRAEAALRAERLLEAVLWTSTFPDAAYIDLLERLDFVAGIDEVQRRIIPRKPKGFPGGLVGAKGSGRPIIKNGHNYLYMNSYPEREWFYPHFPEPAARGLRGYHEAMGVHAATGKNGSRIPLRQIRNVISHGALPADASSWVTESFKGAGLWAGAQPFFLRNQHVDDVIDALTGHDPAEIYESFVDGLCAQLDTHRYEMKET